MNFAMTPPPQTAAVLWGAAGGAAVLAFVGFVFGGWVTGSTAIDLARRQADSAVVVALTPVCVEKFRRAANADENLGRLKAIGFSWERGTYISRGGWATSPGTEEPNSGVAQACAELLSKP